jgi:hypothetical protein
MKKIILPNNNFGLFLMLAILALILIVPFVLTLWVVLLIAPWWVALPVSLAASLFSFLVIVKIKE